MKEYISNFKEGISEALGVLDGISAQSFCSRETEAKGRGRIYIEINFIPARK